MKRMTVIVQEHLFSTEDLKRLEGGIRDVYKKNYSDEEVKMFWMVMPKGYAYSERKLSNALKDLYIHANVRAGRTKETVAELSKQLVDESAAIIQVPASQVKINLMEIQPKWCMEGGHIMPEPGEEDEWFEKVNAALAEREKKLA